MAYDSKNLYFAFKCNDDQPDEIKTSITQRDKIFDDDYVGVAIDTTGSKQTAYEFFVNANGIQGDKLTTAFSYGEVSPDFVWYSAGKVTNEGYQAEIRIPLKSLRYKSGKHVPMGVLFTRSSPKTGTIDSFPLLKASSVRTIFPGMKTAIYKGLKSQLNLEILPNFTYSSDKARADEDNWETENDTNAGVSLKYGLTSTININATINPDFSQVESDSYRVEVNQRYPIFYREKRPFFMEGIDVFKFGIILPGQIITPVDTRRIVDPTFAAKISGSSGKTAFAVLAANDQSPGRQYLEDGTLNPNEGKEAFFAIARGALNIGSDNSIGVLYAGRNFSERKNNVFAADLEYRILKDTRFTISYFHSFTKNDENSETRNGNGLNLMMLYKKKGYTLNAAYEY
ncbi:MAG: carbohydrate binding family 9 domain-containing protein, partial [bacterium]|nr:carbohydrate binding family 9 domain-containing protein [bacterium]